MIKHEINFHSPLKFVMYARMSSEMQNQRSPDQQYDSILREIQSRGFPWSELARFRDDAMTGRTITGRPELMAMRDKIIRKEIQPDLILVDTLERLGRTDDLPAFRDQLQKRHGVIVLTADNGFQDPTTEIGKVLSSLDQFRATSGNALRAHDVHRGKRDAVLLKHWAGGKPPFGYRLKNVMSLEGGLETIAYRMLEPDPLQSLVIRKLFAKAAETAWGTSRLTQFLNADPDGIATGRRFNWATVNLWLSNPVYIGTYVWNKEGTDYVEDRRIYERREEDELVTVEDYCEPLITREVWEAVQTIRAPRQERARNQARQNRDSEKLIQPTSHLLALNYPLSGLVRCGSCGSSMIAHAGGLYHRKNGETSRYVAYVCPSYSSGLCPNSTRFPEQELSQQVFQILQERLFLNLDESLPQT